MKFNGQRICQLLDRYNHDFFTKMPVPETENYEKTAMINSKSQRNSIRSEKLWHQSLGHPGPKLVQHIK